MGSYWIQLKPFGEILVSVLIHSIWQGLLIVSLSSIILALLKNRSAHLRYLIACGAIAILVLAVISTGVYLSNNNTDSGGTIINKLGRMTPVGESAYSPATIISEPSGRDARIAVPWWNSESVHFWFVVIWCLGVMLSSVYHLAGWYNARRLLGMGLNEVGQEWQERFAKLCARIRLKQAVKLAGSTVARVPCVIGALKPVVLFPICLLGSLDPKQVEMIIVHELAHIKRYDVLINIIQTAMETLFFFNPAVWWMSRTIRIEREHCCDDVAIDVSGEKLYYARALAKLEELKMDKTSIATAATGSSLLGRIRRLVGETTSRVDIFGLSLPGILILIPLVVLGLGFWSGNSGQTAQAETAVENSTEFQPRSSDIKGDWELRIGSFNQSLLLYHGRNSMTSIEIDDALIKELADIVASDRNTFQIVREAGTFFFNGKIEKDRGKYRGGGEWYFESNPGFVKKMKQYNLKVKDEDQLFLMAIFDINEEFIQSLRKRGYRNLTIDDLIAAGIHGVNAEFIDKFAEVGLKDIDFDQLIALRIHDVNSADREEFSKLGFRNLTADELIAASIHNITPEIVEEYANAGLGNLTFDQMVAMRIHNIDPSDRDEFSKLGFRNLTADELIAASIHNITPEIVDEYAKAGLDNLTFDQMVAMRIHNIDPSDRDEFSKLGFRNLTADELIAASIHNITPEVVDEYANAGLDDLTFDQLVAMKIHNVKPGDSKRFEKYGLGDLSSDELIAANIHNITPGFIEKFRSAGYRDLSFGSYVKLRIYDVDVDELRDCEKLGFKNITQNDLVTVCANDITPADLEDLADLGYPNLSIDTVGQMFSCGVTPDYIRQLQELGYNNLSPEMLLRMGQAGVSARLVRRLSQQGKELMTPGELIDYRKNRKKSN